METKVRKVGSSLGVILPKNLVTEGTEFEILEVDGTIVLSPKIENFYKVAEEGEFYQSDGFAEVDPAGGEVW
ncbi:MAG: AbrB/MazE/SpoVT family DNA-binding domain-containing protein [Lactobacillales bacterium]|jgi:antitoxin component of MazEF toxin-antitoxin module|nr:AbrB/MazE/SpoVT family DNA-binding domain-containing protein [Lactobacillales bacterium]